MRGGNVNEPRRLQPGQVCRSCSIKKMISCPRLLRCGSDPPVTLSSPPIHQSQSHHQRHEYTNRPNHSSTGQYRDNQVATHPLKHMVIPIIPRSALRVHEKHPRRRPGPHVHHDARELRLPARQPRVVPLPHVRQEPLPRRVADGDVGEGVVPCVAHHGLGGELPEGVVGRRAEDVVAEGAVAAVGDPDGVVEQRVQAGEAAL